MKLFHAFAIFTLFSIVSCEFKTEIKTPTSSTSATSSTSKIRNGIELKSNGIKVSQAFLVFDDGTLVPQSNEVQVNQPVTMRLVIDEGFKAENGKVTIGASEKIETSNGNVLVDEADLFKSQDEIEAARAGVITLKAVITQIDKLYDYFLVSFKVWDKKSNNNVTGSYKLYIK